MNAVTSLHSKSEKVYNGPVSTSSAQLNWVAILLCMLVYMPIITQMAVIGRENVETITYATLILVFIGYLLIGKKSKNTQGTFVLYFVCLALLLVNIVHFVSSSGLQVFLHDSHSFVASILILLIVSQFNDRNQIYIFKVLFNYMGAMFFVLLLLSAFESYSGVYFGMGAEAMEDLTVYAEDPLNVRFIGNAIYSDMSSMLGLDMFSFCFTMMVGQHNQGGAMLVFYNLIFLFAYYAKKETRYAILAGLLLLAVLLNTTRFAIAAIVITDFIFYVLVIKKWVHLQWEVKAIYVFSCVSFAALLVLFFSTQDLPEVLSYFQATNTDTMNGRSIIYASVAEHFLDQDIYHILIGNSGESLKSAIIAVLGVIRNFESFIISVYYGYGLAGIIIIFYALYFFLKQGKALIEPYSYFWYLIIFNVIAISVISGLLFSYHIYPIVVILCLYVLVKARQSANEGVHKQGY